MEEVIYGKVVSREGQAIRIDISSEDKGVRNEG